MRACGGATRRPGSASGSIPTSPKKGGHRAALHGAAAGSVVVCLDEMGPEAAKSFPGQQLVTPARRPDAAERAKQEIDYGRRGKRLHLRRLPAGHRRGVHRVPTIAAPPPTGSTSSARSSLGRSQTSSGSMPSSTTSAPTAPPTCCCSAWLHPRWEFVFQPTYAAYLNLIEPWWKVLRSLALKGRRFETWEEIEQAVERATAYWNEHRHPFVWGRRRRHRQARRLGLPPSQ